MTTNTVGAVAEKALAASGLSGFVAAVSGTDLGIPKPDPLVYLEAARRLGFDTSSVIAFEDSPVGGTSTLGAGLRVVGVPQVGGDPSTTRAQAILDSIFDVEIEN